MKTSRYTVLHFWTPDSLKNVLSFANEKAAELENDQYRFHLCGKVEFMEINKLHVPISKKGYVMDETETELQIRIMEENRIVLI